MLLAMLWFGLLWQTAAPLAVQPGMTTAQVEAILGKPNAIIFTGSINGGGFTKFYSSWESLSSTPMERSKA